MIGVGTFKATPKMKEYVNDVLDTGRISYGPYCRSFEKQFATMHGCMNGVLSNSGTSSLQVAVQALKELRHWHDGDEVIVPSVTFVASVNVVLHNGLKPVLVDVDPWYYELDADLAQQAVTWKTRAIMPVHLFGQPCDMTAVKKLAEDYDLSIIEDSCEAMAVCHAGKPVGSWGDVGCFSTYVAHLLTTGVGGIATTNNDELAVRMRSLVNHGRDGIYISIDDDDDPKNRHEVISKRFRFEHVGHSYRITEMEAALGLAQLPDLCAMIRKRRENARYLTERLNVLGDVLRLPMVRPKADHAWMMYPIVLKNMDKGPLCDYLEAHGVETREMLPLIHQPCYDGLWNPRHYPVADWIERGGLYLGCHQDLTHDDLDYMAETIRGYFK